MPPRWRLDASPLRDALQIVPLADFKPQVDLWSVWRPGSPRIAAVAHALGAIARDAFRTPARGEAEPVA